MPPKTPRPRRHTFVNGSTAATGVNQGNARVGNRGGEEPEDDNDENSSSSNVSGGGGDETKRRRGRITKPINTRMSAPERKVATNDDTTTLKYAAAGLLVALLVVAIVYWWQPWTDTASSTTTVKKRKSATKKKQKNTTLGIEVEEAIDSEDERKSETENADNNKRIRRGKPLPVTRVPRNAKKIRNRTDLSEPSQIKGGRRKEGGESRGRATAGKRVATDETQEGKSATKKKGEATRDYRSPGEFAEAQSGDMEEEGDEKKQEVDEHEEDEEKIASAPENGGDDGSGGGGGGCGWSSGTVEARESRAGASAFEVRGAPTAVADPRARSPDDREKLPPHRATLSVTCTHCNRAQRYELRTLAQNLAPLTTPSSSSSPTLSSPTSANFTSSPTPCAGSTSHPIPLVSSPIPLVSPPIPLISPSMSSKTSASHGIASVPGSNKAGLGASVSVSGHVSSVSDVKSPERGSRVNSRIESADNGGPQTDDVEQSKSGVDDMSWRDAESETVRSIPSRMGTVGGGGGGGRSVDVGKFQHASGVLKKGAGSCSTPSGKSHMRDASTGKRVVSTKPAQPLSDAKTADGNPRAQKPVVGKTTSRADPKNDVRQQPAASTAGITEKENEGDDDEDEEEEEDGEGDEKDGADDDAEEEKKLSVAESKADVKRLLKKTFPTYESVTEPSVTRFMRDMFAKRHYYTLTETHVSDLVQAHTGQWWRGKLALFTIVKCGNKLKPEFERIVKKEKHQRQKR
jgi:hypothetical protein